MTLAAAGDTCTLIGGTIVTAAVADLEGSATEVAVTETCGEAGTADGAVNRPEELIVPHAVPEQPLPEMVQETAAFDVPDTLAVNCCEVPITTWADAGEIFTATNGRTVTVAVLDLVGSASDVAVTDTCAGLGTVDGAWYRPAEDIVPHAVPLQPLPATVQEMPAFEVLLTVAVNCCVAPCRT
jgi:hypothetical protein